jgi:hypothetical protein
LPIFKVKHAVADASKTLVMSDDYRSQPLRSVNLLEQAMNAFACLAVEVTRRFVCQQQTWAGNERSCQRDPGLLATGQLSGPVGNSIREPDTSQHRLRSLYRCSARAAPDEQRHHRIFNCGELGQQVMKLENETNFPVPKPRQVYITEFEDVKFADFYSPPSRTI